MKLEIKRKQIQKSVFGLGKRIVFTTYFRVIPDADEEQLIKRYSLQNELLGMHLWSKGSGPTTEGNGFLDKIVGIYTDLSTGNKYLQLSIATLLSGKEVEADPAKGVSLPQLLELESAVVASCSDLIKLLEVMNNYSESEIIEFDKEGNPI